MNIYTNIMEYSCLLIAAISSGINTIYLKSKYVSDTSFKINCLLTIYYTIRIFMIFFNIFPKWRCFADYPAATLLFYLCTKNTNKFETILPFLIISIVLCSLDTILFCIYKNHIIFLQSLTLPVFSFKEQLLRSKIMETYQKFPNILEEDPPKYNAPKENKNCNRNANLYMRLTEYMEKERPYLKSSLTVIDVARALCTNKTYISNVINEVTKGNFRQYINDYRIQYAQHLLLENNMLTIKEVAQMVGFCSASAFHETFKQKSGKSPKEWLKENRSIIKKSLNFNN